MEQIKNPYEYLRKQLKDPTQEQLDVLNKWVSNAHDGCSITGQKMQSYFESLMVPSDHFIYRGIAIPETIDLSVGTILKNHISFSKKIDCAEQFAESNYHMYHTSLFDESYRKYIIIIPKNALVIPVYPYLIESSLHLFTSYANEEEYLNTFDLKVTHILNYKNLSYIFTSQIYDQKKTLL